MTRKEIIKEIIEVLKSTLGQKVIYSKAGGGAGSILLQKFDNKVSIWSSYYWTIYQHNEQIATADDDITPNTGPVAMGAKQMLGKHLLGFTLWPDLIIDLYYEDDIEYTIYPNDFIMFPDEDEDYDNLGWEIWDEPQNRCYELDGNLDLLVSPYS